MADPFIGEIRVFAGNFAPTGWALCDGQLLPIAQNTALFSLLGTTYGGDGRTNFALPNLQGRGPVFSGQGPGLSAVALGEQGGAATVTLTLGELPQHRHTHGGAATTDRPGPGLVPADGSTLQHPSAPSEPHANLPPYLVCTYIIALQGVFPPRT